MVTVVNSKADVLKATQALAVNVSAAKSLQEIMRTNLGPRGTLKMLVGGAGQIKITKDGKALLDEMQIQHPTACMIARAATAQDDMTGDGTTTNVLFIGELMKLSEAYLAEGLHPRMIVEGFDLARAETLRFLARFVRKVEVGGGKAGEDKNAGVDRELLINVCRTSLRTKLPQKLALQLADICTDAVLCVRKDTSIEGNNPQDNSTDVQNSNEVADLHMVEILAMKHKLANETRLVKGLVLDHGSRHPDMPKKLENCYILTANVSLEYEKTEVNSGFYYNSADQRNKLADSERAFTDHKVNQLIALKRKVVDEANEKELGPAEKRTPEQRKKEKSFVLINQKGIDGPSLEALAAEGIIALRRAKRRNMERMCLAAGGNAVNSFDDLDEDDLGYADIVYEYQIEDDKFTFVEGLRNPLSCSILITGPNDHTIYQIRDAVKDGMRSVLNTLEDKCVVAGAGAFEVGCSSHLDTVFKKTVQGKARLGVEIFAKALLVIPKVLIENSGLDMQETVLNLVSAYERKEAQMEDKVNGKPPPCGVDLMTGEVCDPELEGIWDNMRVKKQLFNLAPVLAQQLLLVDEIIRAGIQMKK